MMELTDQVPSLSYMYTEDLVEEDNIPEIKFFTRS